MTDHNDPLLTPAEAAKRLGIHRETLYLWMKKGAVRYVLVGRFVGRRKKRIRASEVARQLEECNGS